MLRRLGAILFRFRSYTPIPLVVIALLASRPTVYKVALGCLFIAAGETIRIWAAGYLGGSGRTRTVGGDVLITSGPFSFTRNPLYLGNLFLSLGFLICLWPFMPYSVFILVGLFVLQYWPIVEAEEQYLNKAFGREYRRYRRSVSSFFPAFQRYDGVRTEYDLGRAMRAERPTFQTIGGLFLLLILRWFVFSSILPLL